MAYKTAIHSNFEERLGQVPGTFPRQQSQTSTKKNSPYDTSSFTATGGRPDSEQWVTALKGIEESNTNILGHSSQTDPATFLFVLFLTLPFLLCLLGGDGWRVAEGHPEPRAGSQSSAFSLHSRSRVASCVFPQVLRGYMICTSNFSVIPGWIRSRVYQYLFNVLAISACMNMYTCMSKSM